MVREYVVENNIKTPFKNDRPGRTWIKMFLKRNKLSLKKASMICISRKSNTANPFVIYDFYDKLENILNDNPEIKSENIWNCDESGFPTDPSKSKVVGPCNEPAFKLSFGARRENITTLAVCNASGIVLDPLVIFQGKNFQSSWKGKHALKNTYYGVSENGWMETNIFADWFEAFTTNNKGRPMLLLFDGHMTHISIRVIERALQDNIHLLKFPPHVTDILQPLDKCCFGPLKRLWEKTLNERINKFGLARKVDKAEFVNILAKVWHEGLNEKNVIAGFESTGIWPLNRDKYDKSRFDIRLLRRYEDWVASGKPPLDWTHCNNGKDIPEATGLNGSQSLREQQPSSSCANTPITSESALQNEFQFSTEVMQVIGSFPYPSPPGFKWVPNGWKLVPTTEIPTAAATKETSTPVSAVSTPIQNKSFEEIFLDRIKPINKSPTKKRSRVNLAATIISDKELLQKLKEKEANTKANKNNENNEIDYVAETIVEESEESEVESSDDEGNERVLVAPKNVDDALKLLRKCWNVLAPPTKEEYIQECYFAVIYVDPKLKRSMFIGKAIKRWLHDEQGTVQAITFDFLKPKTINEDDILEKHDQDGTDQDIVPVHQIIAGPLRIAAVSTTSYRSKRRVRIFDYEAIVKVYALVKKLDLQKAYDQYLCSGDRDSDN